MNDVMIDLETIGNDYDGIFTTIGACEFNRDSGDIGRKFYASVNWESAIEAGRTVTPSTIKWWMTQTEAARSEIVKNGKPIDVVLKEFANWFPEDSNAWGCGPTFDIGKLENAYGYYDIPWKFYRVRCVRTIRDLAFGKVDISEIPFEGEKHNALDDAIHQAKYVSKMFAVLTK